MPLKSFSHDLVYVEGYHPHQLGNQLFMISATLSYAWDNQMIPIFPYLKESDRNEFYYQRMLYKLDVRPPPFPFKNKYIFHGFFYQKIPYIRNVRLEGMFPSWKYFHHHREEIMETFAPSTAILNEINAKYSELLTLPNTVSVHVRTYSKKICENDILFVGMQYYRQALEKFPKSSVFVIFSDRINWCKVHFTKEFPEKQFVFIEGNDNIFDLYLMSMMKNNILANSSYSWWGAYLNTNRKKKVIVPSEYLKKVKWSIKDFYLPEWTIVKSNDGREPYPSDMYDYDEGSNSLYPDDQNH